MIVPLAETIRSRNGLPFSDSYILNGYVNGTKVSKRPALQLANTLPTGTGQAMFSMSGVDYAIIGDVIYNVATSASFAIPSITTANLRYQTVSNPPYLATALTVLKSTAGMWTFNGTTVTKVTDANYPSVTIPGVSLIDGTYYVQTPSGKIFGSNIADPTTWSALNVVTVNSLQGSSVALATNNLYVASFGSHWITQYYDAANPAPGSPLSQNLPGTIAIGCASADSIVTISSFVVFMSQVNNGRSISVLSQNSVHEISTPDINRILDNDSLAIVYAFGITIAGNNFYVISLSGTNITLVFDFTSKVWTYWSSINSVYTAQTSLVLQDDLETVTGSGPGVLSHQFQVGDVITITGALDNLFNGTFSITAVDGNNFSFKVSYPGFLVNEYGFYLVNENGVNVVGRSVNTGIVQGTITVSWYVDNMLTAIASTGANLLLDKSNGKIYKMNTQAYVDDSGAIDFICVTKETMAKDTVLKRIGGIEVVGDKVDSLAYVRYTDDTFNTWSDYVPIDLSIQRSKTNRCGSTRRRAFCFRHTGNTPCRVKDLYIDVDWVEGGT